MKAEANERLLTLSTPKPRNDGPFREPEWEVILEVSHLSPFDQNLVI